MTRKLLLIAWGVQLVTSMLFVIVSGVAMKKLSNDYGNAGSGDPLRSLLGGIISILSGSFILAHTMCWSSLAIILGKSISRRGFGTGPGFMVGCCLGAFFGSFVALFFCGGMLVAAAKTLKGAISDASGAYDAVLGLAYTAGAGYLGMAAALFKWRDALLPTAAQAAQLEAELAAAKMLPAAQQQPKRGGLFGFGAQRDTPPPPPGGGPAPVQPAGAAAHKPVSTAGGAWGMV